MSIRSDCFHLQCGLPQMGHMDMFGVHWIFLSGTQCFVTQDIQLGSATRCGYIVGMSQRKMGL